MAEIVRIARVEAVLHGVLKIVWRDGFEGLVDLRAVLDQGKMFEFLRADPARFDAVALEPHGGKIYGLDDAGDEIDFGSASLRRRAERQAELLRLAS